MVIQVVSGWECARTVLAVIRNKTRKVDIFHMFAQIGPVAADFSTNGTFERSILAINWSNILIQK